MKKTLLALVYLTTSLSSTATPLRHLATKTAAFRTLTTAKNAGVKAAQNSPKHSFKSFIAGTAFGAVSTVATAYAWGKHYIEETPLNEI